MPEQVVDTVYQSEFFYNGESVSITLLRETLVLHDEIYNPYGWEEEKVLITTSEKISTRQIIDGSDNIFTAVFFLDGSGKQTSRFNYNILQFIGDVGALFGTLQAICAFFMFTFFRMGVLLDNYLISSIFREKDETEKI